MLDEVMSITERIQWFHRNVTSDTRVLEVGPGYNPLFGGENFSCVTVDHADTEALKSKWRDNPLVSTENIPHIDIVWKEGTLRSSLDSVIPGAQFDLVVASHVIEHLPDPLGFLKDANNAAVNGVIRLAIPDKRYCFDLFKQLSTTGQLVTAHYLDNDAADIVNRGKYIDHLLADAHCGEEVSWGDEKNLQPHFVTSLLDILRTSASNDAGDYVDFHRWTFTPSSFLLMILELNAISETNLEVTSIRRGLQFEFLCELRQAQGQPFLTDDSLESTRSRLRRDVIAECAVQDTMIR